MFQDCTYWGITGEFGLIGCADPYQIYVGTYQQCFWVADPNSTGGGGYTPPTSTPCSQVQSLGTSSDFQAKMQDLKTRTSLNYEAAYIMRNDAYEYIQGANNELSMSLPINYINPIDGFLHSHYNDPQALSIFSPSDIKAIYDSNRALGIKNIETFTAGVVTASGTTYLLKVVDKTAFMNFGSVNLQNPAAFLNFEDEMSVAVNSHSPEFVQESGFLNAIRNSGLMLFKGNITTFNQWDRRILNSSNVPVNTNCND